MPDIYGLDWVSNNGPMSNSCVALKLGLPTENRRELSLKSIAQLISNRTLIGLHNCNG